MSFQRKQEKDFTKEVKDLVPEAEALAKVSSGWLNRRADNRTAS